MFFSPLFFSPHTVVLLWIALVLSNCNYVIGVASSAAKYIAEHICAYIYLQVVSMVPLKNARILICFEGVIMSDKKCAVNDSQIKYWSDKMTSNAFLNK